MNEGESMRQGAEEQLRLQSAALEAAANAIVITDRAGKIIWVNPAFTQHTGYSFGGVLGKTPRLLKSGKQDSTFYKEMWDTILSGKVWRNTLLNRRNDGTLNHEDLTITPILDATGTITHFVGIKQDITQLEQALSDVQKKNEELASMTQQLWQASKLATMGELASSIAHELNNPLATVGLRTENLLMQMPADSDERKPLEIIAQEVDRMATLVENLLQFSRRSHRQVSTVDPREEVNTSVEFVHYHLRNRKIEVVREFADSLPTIQADRQQLRQLFLNLLTNASDAMPEGGKLTLRAVSSKVRDAKAVAIEVEDTGEGVAPENLEKIWEPFFTTKAEGKGTGLGMGICRRIVEEHGGTISIKSEGAGQGTTVSIVLPATDSKEVLTSLESEN
jgi:PAS domain S-box-containing protein